MLKIYLRLTTLRVMKNSAGALVKTFIISKTYISYGPIRPKMFLCFSFQQGVTKFSKDL